MASVNRVILIGNVGNDPEVRFMPNGDAVANFSIATTDQWKDKSGQKQEATEWHRIVMYRKLAEIVQSYVKKGASLYIEGRLQSHKWTDKAGIERTTIQIIGEQLRMLGGKQDNHGAGGEPTNQGAGAGTNYNTPIEDIDSDIPFNQAELKQPKQQ